MARAKKKQQVEAPAEVTEETIVVQAEDTLGEVDADGVMVVNQETEGVEETVVSEGTPETVAEESTEELALTQEDVRLVEAILFATAGALTVNQIAERFPAERVKIIPDVLEYLKEQYANRGVNLVQRNERWALRTATDLGDQLRIEKEQPKKFTRSAMETMAIIAYHQPVTRAEIENIRGVATAPGALDALMEAGWIKPGKRREVPGRPVTWLSTQGFLDHFGLEKLEDLPGMDELKAAGLLDKRPAIEAMPTADLFGEDENKQEIDPQEVTDEDLVGKVTEEGGSAAELDGGNDDADDEEEEFDGDDEDSGDADDDEDGDDEEASDDDDSDDSDDEDSDDEEASDDDEDFGDDDDDDNDDDEDSDKDDK